MKGSCVLGGVLVKSASHNPASNTAAVVTIAANAEHLWALRKIVWSYDATPTGGSVKVEIGGIEVLDHDISQSGPGYIPLEDGLSSDNKNESLVVTLAAGGSGVTGKLTILYT